MCPYLEKADGRCAAHLTFANLFSAFEHCADTFTACRVFQQLAQESPNDQCYVSCTTSKFLVAS